MSLSAYNPPQFQYGNFQPQNSGYQMVPAAPTQLATVTKTYNPFHYQLAPYFGEIGAPNPTRPALRPTNDKLDRFVAICVEKLDFGLNQIKSLADEIQRFQYELTQSNTGGDPELRTQLGKANKEIHRLRTLLATQPGAVFDEEVEAEALPQEQFNHEDPQGQVGPIF